MTDKKQCEITNESIRIIKKAKGYSAIVGNEHFPGRSAYIRVGQGKPIAPAIMATFRMSQELSAASMAVQSCSQGIPNGLMIMLLILRLIQLDLSKQIFF